MKNKIEIRNCPVCNSGPDRASLFLEKNYDESKVSGFSFASRKNPEFMCHHLVKCSNCDLVYADSPPSVEELAEQYHEASFDSDEEANDASKSYGKALSGLFKILKNKNKALDIGAGTGVFLDELQSVGFKNLVGIEPSLEPIAAAPEHRRSWLINDIFKEDMFQEKTFDFIGCFMTMEHVRDPKIISDEAMKILNDNGAVAFVVHDHNSIVNKVLGKKSPIIDIEHMQLFSKKSIKTLLSLSGYTNIQVRSFYNKYPLKYWVRLLPLPNNLKNLILRFLRFIRADSIKISINVGNLIAYGIKPKTFK
jgi:SAM-dependent methyltransferase